MCEGWILRLYLNQSSDWKAKKLLIRGFDIAGAKFEVEITILKLPDPKWRLPRILHWR